MSRSGYSEDGWGDEYASLRAGAWRANLRRMYRGQKARKFLTELRDALDALPERRLVANAFETEGAFCALGTVAKSRGVPMPEWDAEDDYDYGEGASEDAGVALHISKTLAAEIMHVNDDSSGDETPEQRWLRVRHWAAKKLREWPWPKSRLEHD